MMFSNLIYIIIVVLIYATYQPSEETNFTFPETFILFIFLLILFTWITWVQFHKINKKAASGRFQRLDNQYNNVLTRQSIMAVVFIAIDIYGLNLTSFLSLSRIPFLKQIPTLQAIFLICIFFFYMAVIWICGYKSYRKIYMTDLSRRSYILSNISLSVPVLLPWLLLSGFADIIDVLPFETLKHFLATTEGEAVYFLLFLLVVTIIGPVLIQKFWQCKPLKAGFYRTRIEELCRKAGIKYKNILCWPIFGGRMITAGVLGLIKNFRYILVTDALLRFLEPDEIDAVITHEIGHIKQKHLLFYLFFFVGYMLLSYATFDLIIYFIISSKPVYQLIKSSGFEQTTMTSAIFSSIIIIMFLIYFRCIFGYFMRNFERQADIYVYTLFDNAKALISTFEKIVQTSGQPPDSPNWHHFSISQRIEYLKKCEEDKIWITRHNRKVKKSIVIYFLAIFLLGIIGYNLNFGEIGEKLNKNFFEKIILQNIEKDPNNPELYSILGDIYYSRKLYAKTVKAYEQVITFQPDNPKVLNNLAWLYATCEDKKFYQPGQALILAKKAAGIDKTPTVLDTLAECFYANGQYHEAVSVEMQALQLVRKNKTYYEKQLEKFLKAAEKKKDGS